MGNLTVKESGEMVNIISPNVNNITSFKVHFSPKQEGTGDPSPENVREIVGWNGVEGYKCGKNIAHIVGYSAKTINEPYADKYLTNNYGTTINTTEPVGEVIVTQANWDDSKNKHHYSNGYFGIIDDNLLFGQKYKVSFRITNITDNPLNSSLSDIRITSPKGGGYNVYIDGDYIYGVINYLPYPSLLNRHGIEIRNCGMSFTMSDFMVTAVDNEDYTYEPFQGTTTSIDWTNNIGNIYGGYVDLISGELVSSWYCCPIKDVPGTWSYRSNNMRFQVQLEQNVMPNNNSEWTNYTIAEAYKKSSGVGYSVNQIATYIDSLFYPHIYIRDDSFEGDVEAFLEIMGATKIAYPLATTVTYQLSSAQLETLKGQNNFWSNADYIEIEYELTETFDIQKAKRKIILNQPHVEMMGGDLISLNADMKAPLKECKVYFNPIQKGSDDPSPDNIRNITGWNGITATRSGKNLVEVSAETRVYQNPTSNTNFTEDNNIIIITGSSNGGYRTSCKPNTQYTYSCEPTLKSGGVYLRVWEEIGEERNMIINQNVNSTKGAVATFTTGSDVYSLIVGFYVYSTAAQTGLTISDFQLELGDTRTAYEPYQSTAISIDWTDSAGTIYGGYVDLISGELVVNMAIVDLGTLTWTYIEQYTTFISYPIDLMSISTYKKGLCSQYRMTNQWLTSQELASDDKIFSLRGQDGRIRIKDTAYTDASAFKTSVDGVQFVYELANPIHYQLTPQQFIVFKGMNNIFSDSNGTIDIKFWTHNRIIDYLKDTEWLDRYYITSTGKLTNGGNVALSHVTTTSIYLPKGRYNISGFCNQEYVTGQSLNCRVHEYDANNQYVKLIANNEADFMSDYSLEFSLDHDSYIKLSLPRMLECKLIKLY